MSVTDHCKMLTVTSCSTSLEQYGSRVQYIMAGTKATLSSCLFPIFRTTLFLSIQQPCISNNMQYLADKDVSKIIWFQEMIAQVPKS
jgi:hypothetical protein